MEIVQFSYPNWNVVDKKFDTKKINDYRKHFLSFLSLLNKEENFFTSLNISDTFRHVYLSILCEIDYEELIELQNKNLDILVLNYSISVLNVMISASLYDFYYLLVNNLQRSVDSLHLRNFLTSVYYLFEDNGLDLIFKEHYTKEIASNNSLILKRK